MTPWRASALGRAFWRPVAARCSRRLSIGGQLRQKSFVQASSPAQTDIKWDALSDADVELFESLQSVVEALGDDASDHPVVEVRDKLAVAFRDKAALLKRNWTDEMFQEGEHLNEEKVSEIEAAMAADLGNFSGGLYNGQNLGNALDLVGAYMKNYKLDKADAVLAKCGPFVAQRGGVWMVKWLNHDWASGLLRPTPCQVAKHAMSEPM